MADNIIRVGDLVQIVKPKRCGCTDTLWFIFRVVDIKAPEKKLFCINCGRLNAPKCDMFAYRTFNSGVELWRLKKINPPEILVTEREVDEITV